MMDNSADMLRPPINRSMKVLDRAFFNKTVPVAAARVSNNQHISQCRKELQSSGDLAFTNLSRIHSVVPDPLPDLAQQGRRCLLLQDRIKADDSSTWTETVKKLHDDQKITLFPYELKLDYDSWDYQDIIHSILPTDIDEVPSSFAIVGHIAHLNLREPVWPYKHMIAQVIVDKNPMIRTVINKIDDVGSENAFRTFKYEVLAGPDDMDVTVLEGNCTFKFNYAQVYWNARLQTEHLNMVNFFDEGDAVCDVMAGIGPFAVPAGKNRVFCWANDLNPNSYASMVDAVKRNKVSEYVRPFNEDGHTFIRRAAAELWRTDHTVEIKKAASRSSGKPPEIRRLTQPRTFKHYVMNLPASALDFVPDFRGLYSEIEATEQVPVPTPETAPLPFVHVYCFSTKSDDNVAETKEICEKISSLLGLEMKPGDGKSDRQVLVRDVRDVAPKKRMFCASFQLPREVAWC